MVIVRGKPEGEGRAFLCPRAAPVQQCMYVSRQKSRLEAARGRTLSTYARGFVKSVWYALGGGAAHAYGGAMGDWGWRVGGAAYE
jgi:hypothetical protein